MYDIFYVSDKDVNALDWLDFQSRFPNAQLVENCNSFEILKNKSLTKHFWVVWDNLKIQKDFDFNYRIPEWDTDYIHVFKNGKYYDGVCIFPKSAKILQREWDYRFFTNKKELDIQCTDIQNYDVIFISYNEDFSDRHYKTLRKKVPTAKRVHGVKGIHQAHIEAAKLSTTELFYVVDADAIVEDDFTFDMQIPYYDFNGRQTVYVWRSKNSVNDLEYGYGGVKLFPRQMTIDMDLTKPDMTTSISKNFKAMDTVANSTLINTDPFTAWKSAFRECVKLSSRIIDRQDNTETEERLRIWCTVGAEKEYGEFVLRGANEGKEFGKANSNKIDQLRLINDFKWLEEKFNAG